MKNYSILFSLLISSVALAQQGIDGMVQSELKFAAFALSNSTKEAFIKYADSAGVIFENGEAINARSFWGKKEKRPGILRWRPRFAEIANSGDFGYTTGSWTFQPLTITDSIIAAGHFFTVWQLNKHGNWQFLLDMGTSNAPIESTSSLEKISLLTFSKLKAQDSSIIDVEYSFINTYNKSPQLAYKKYLSNRSILNREQMSFAILPTDKEALLSTYTEPAKLTPLKSGLATSGDLGYVYGVAEYKGKKGNYLHIWRHEKKGWKVALELIQH